MQGKKEGLAQMSQAAISQRKLFFSGISEAKSNQNPYQCKDYKKEKQKANKRRGSLAVFLTLLRYTANRWQFAFACFLATILSGLLQALFPWKLGNVLDTLGKQINSQQQFQNEEMKTQFLYLLIISIFMTIFLFFRIYFLRLYQEKLSIDLQSQIFSRFIKNDLHFFQTYKSGELISRLNNDVNKAKEAISKNLTVFLKNLVNVVVTLSILIKISWKLSLIVLCVIPFYAIITMKYMKKAKKLGKLKQDYIAESCVNIGEKFNGIQTIKSFCSEEEEIKLFFNQNMSIYTIVKENSIYEAIYRTLSAFLPSFAAIIVLFYAFKNCYEKNHSFSTGELTAFILYCNGFGTIIKDIAKSLTSMVSGTSAIQKVFQMMNYERLVVEDVGKEVQISGSVEFNKVGFKYPQAESFIFKDLTFQINPGQYVAFVGQSGSGKSTVTKLIEHFYRIHEGSIFFGEHDSSEMNVKKIRQQIGLVSQEATIFSGTIEENITYGMDDYSLTDMEKAAEKAGCLDFIKNARLFPQGYQTVVGERGVNLSGGQRQRISIARALMRKPKILIFDEATSALDSNSEHLVQQSIEELANDSSITIIVVAHRLSTVINCDRLYVMKEGNIVEVGAHRDLIREKGYYYTLIQKQLHEDYQNQHSLTIQLPIQQNASAQKLNKNQSNSSIIKFNPQQQTHK